MYVQNFLSKGNVIKKIDKLGNYRWVHPLRNKHRGCLSYISILMNDENIEYGHVELFMQTNFDKYSGIFQTQIFFLEKLCCMMRYYLVHTTYNLMHMTYYLVRTTYNLMHTTYYLMRRTQFQYKHLPIPGT